MPWYDGNEYDIYWDVSHGIYWDLMGFNGDLNDLTGFNGFE